MGDPFGYHYSASHGKQWRGTEDQVTVMIFSQETVFITWKRAIRHCTYELHAGDACSEKMWVQWHQRYVLFFQENWEMEAFVLCMQTQWQLQQMLHYGHNSFRVSAISSFWLCVSYMVSIFNSWIELADIWCLFEQYPLHTLLLFDSCQNLTHVKTWFPLHGSSQLVLIPKIPMDGWSPWLKEYEQRTMDWGQMPSL